MRILWFFSLFFVIQVSLRAQQLLPEQITAEQAVQEALDHNLGLLAERYNLSIAEARIVTARLRPNPVFSLSGDHLPLAGTTYNSANNAGPPEYAVRTDFVLERG